MNDQKKMPSRQREHKARPVQHKMSTEQRRRSHVNSRIQLILNILTILLFLLSIFLFIRLGQARRDLSSAQRQLEEAANYWMSLPDYIPPENSGDAAITVSFAEHTEETVTLGSEIESEYAILIDLETNTVAAEKNSDEIIYPASLTKVMTLIVAVENLSEEELTDTFNMTYEIINPLVAQGASRAGFMVGEKVPIIDLLYGAILPSGADATEALAIHIAGSEENFVKLMNAKAKAMGLSRTQFTNASGLHDYSHYSTVHEMALIMEYAMQNELCRSVLTTKSYTTSKTEKNPEGLKLYSDTFNRMYGDEPDKFEVIAGKTGYTSQAKHCLASYGVTDSGRAYIFVSASAGDSKYSPIYDCIKVYSEYTKQ
jgi:D-alanyl-D-alanine carboxypeptidase (penicillin-binding protein 5/6)